MLHWGLVTAALPRPSQERYNESGNQDFPGADQSRQESGSQQKDPQCFHWASVWPPAILICRRLPLWGKVEGSERGREGGKPGHSSQQESSTAKSCTGTQDYAVCRRLDFGAASGMAQIAQEKCCPKPGSRNSSGRMSCHILPMSGKSTQYILKLCKNSKMLCTTVIYNMAISLSSVALCEIAQLLS